MQRSVYVITLTAMLWALSSSPPIEAATVFTKVVDTNTPIPGGVGNFTALNEPSLDGGDVAFAGFGSSVQRGVYVKEAGGVLRVVANKSTPIPGGTANFLNLDAPSIQGGNTVFRGSAGSFFSEGGFYSDLGGTLRVVADKNTPIPGGVGNFEHTITDVGFARHSLLDGNSIVFTGRGSSGQRGLYIEAGGVLQVVADKNTPVPGGVGNFIFFEFPWVDEGNVVFGGFDSDANPGIYVCDGGALRIIADQSVPIPGGVGTFDTPAVRHPSLDGGNVAFVLDTGTQDGVFAEFDGALRVVADNSTTLPGQHVPGAGPVNVSLEGHQVAFFAGGIFVEVDGSLKKAIDGNDSLDGKDIVFISTTRGRFLSDNTVVFVAGFADGTQAIYTATLNKPPVALSDGPFLGIAGDPVMMDASATSDPYEDALRFT